LSGLSFFRVPHRCALWTVPAAFPRLRALQEQWETLVGKGDRRTRRGKIYAGSFGKLRPKDPSSGKAKAKARPAAPAAAKPAAKTARPAAKRAKS
jgi:30S ribosomal protein S31